MEGSLHGWTTTCCASIVTTCSCNIWLYICTPTSCTIITAASSVTTCHSSMKVWAVRVINFYYRNINHQ